MNTAFKTSFVRDLKKISNQRTLNQIYLAIDAAEKCQNIYDISGVKQIKGTKNHFRIRIGTYRIGLVLEDDKLYFVRYLPRKDIYKLFP